jgi:hypothetical protein
MIAASSKKKYLSTRFMVVNHCKWLVTADTFVDSLIALPASLSSHISTQNHAVTPPQSWQWAMQQDG